LGFLVGHYYAIRQFNKHGRYQGAQMINNTVWAYQQTLLKQLRTPEWMDKTTIESAQKKLEHLRYKVGYPDKYPDYEELYVEPQKYFETAMKARFLATTELWATIGHPVDRDAWDVRPQEVKGYYRENRNELIFPAGIMQSPQFRDDYPIFKNYAGVGFLMARELAHAFDKVGALYDATGALKTWWTNKTTALFKSKQECIVKLYNVSINIPDDKNSVMVNSNATFEQNLVDLEGLQHAFAAYKQAEQLEPEELVVQVFKDMNSDKLFFVSFAQNYCSVYGKEYLKFLLLVDDYAPDKLRVNIPLANFPEFAKTFSCKAGSVMNPAKRCDVF